MKEEKRAATSHIRSRPLLQILNTSCYGHVLIVNYSSRNARSGSSRVARRAGTRPVTTAMTASSTIAIANDAGAADCRPLDPSEQNVIPIEAKRLCLQIDETAREEARSDEQHE